MIKFVAVAVAILTAPIGAIAAPFCLALPLGSTQCIYYDGAECAREAGRQNGSCNVNPSEMTLPASRVGSYCLVVPGGTANCGYEDGNICARDALAQKGACSRSFGAGPRSLPDSYEPNAGR